MSPPAISRKSSAAPVSPPTHGGNLVLQCAQFWRDFPPDVA